MADFEWQIRHEVLIYSNYSCHISYSTFADVQTSTPNRFNPSTGRFAQNFLNFLTKNGFKVNEAPCRYVNIAPMQSNMLNFMKILKSCFKVIQRTLIERNPTPRGGFLFTMFPHQEPWVRGTPSKNLYQVLQGGSSYSRFLMMEHSK